MSDSDALIEAIERHDVERLVALLDAGEDPNKIFQCRYGIPRTPLQAAVAELGSPREGAPGGPIEAVVLLLRYGASVGELDERRAMSPFLTAVQINHIEAVRLLLAAGADPSVRGEEGESPLRLCAENGFLEIARLLLRCGATKTIDEAGGGAGMNALGLAATRLNVDMVKLLLEHGADPNAPDLDRLTTLKHLDYLDVPEDPVARERYHEIRRLVGGT